MNKYQSALAEAERRHGVFTPRALSFLAGLNGQRGSHRASYGRSPRGLHKRFAMPAPKPPVVIEAPAKRKRGRPPLSAEVKAARAAAKKSAARPAPVRGAGGRFVKAGGDR